MHHERMPAVQGQAGIPGSGLRGQQAEYKSDNSLHEKIPCLLQAGLSPLQGASKPYMERLLNSRWFHAGFSAFLALSTVVVYSNTFDAAFHFDDFPKIVDNYLIRDLRNLPAIITGQRGLTMATFALNYAVGGLDVTGYHVVNTLIHVANAVLAYFLLFNTLSLGGGGEPWSKKVAAYASLLFALHPIQTESVTYIVQRMESLSSLFYLAALLVFIKAARARAAAGRAILYAGVVVCYILGFYSKEVAVTLPAVLFLYDFYFLGNRSIRTVAARWPLYAVMFLLLVYFVFATIVPLGGFGDLSDESAGRFAAAVTARGGAPSAGFGVSGISPLEYLYTQFNVLVYYIALLLVPVNQNLDYDFPVSTGLFEVPAVREGTVLNIPIPPPVVSLVVLLCIMGMGVYLFRRSRGGSGAVRAAVASFFIFWFFIILSPTSSFIPIIDVIFEHRVYLASLGFFAIFALCFDWFFNRVFGRG